MSVSIRISHLNFNRFYLFRFSGVSLKYNYKLHLWMKRRKPYCGQSVENTKNVQLPFAGNIGSIC